MRKRLSAAIPLAALAIAVLALAIASTASAGGRPLGADLSGSNEVPPVSTGDPDGSGTADLTFNQGQGEICLQIEVQNIAAPILQHIHRGAAGVNGPVVVPKKSADSRLVTTGTQFASRQQRPIRVWEVATGQETATLLQGLLEQSIDLLPAFRVHKNSGECPGLLAAGVTWVASAQLAA